MISHLPNDFTSAAVPVDVGLEVRLLSGSLIMDYHVRSKYDVETLSLAFVKVLAQRLCVPSLCIHLVWPSISSTLRTLSALGPHSLRHAAPLSLVCALLSSYDSQTSKKERAIVYCILVPMTSEEVDADYDDDQRFICGDVSAYVVAEYDENCFRCGVTNLCAYCRVQLPGGPCCFACLTSQDRSSIAAMHPRTQRRLLLVCTARNPWRYTEFLFADVYEAVGGA